MSQKFRSEEYLEYLKSQKKLPFYISYSEFKNQSTLNLFNVRSNRYQTNYHSKILSYKPLFL